MEKFTVNQGESESLIEKKEEEPIVNNALGSQCVVREVTDGYEILFFDPDAADSAIKAFWKMKDPRTEQYFKSGNWNTNQTISFGPRTSWGDNILAKADEERGFQAKIFIGGNTQKIDEKSKGILEFLRFLPRQK